MVSNLLQRRTPPCAANHATHIILVLHIDLAPVLTQAHSLFLCDLLVLAVVPLVSQCSGGRKHEGADNDRREEGEAEQRKGVLLESFAVARGDRVGERRAEGLRGEWARHGGSFVPEACEV